MNTMLDLMGGLAGLLAMGLGMVLMDHAGRAQSSDGTMIGYTAGQFFGIVCALCLLGAVLDVSFLGRLPWTQWNLLMEITMIPGSALFGGLLLWAIRAASAKGQRGAQSQEVPR